MVSQKAMIDLYNHLISLIVQCENVGLASILTSLQNDPQPLFLLFSYDAS